MVFEKLKKIVREQFDINLDKVTLDSDFRKDLELDSLDIVEILMCVEEEWGIVLDDSETASLKTVGDVVAIIEKKAG